MKAQLNHRIWIQISLALAISAGGYLSAAESYRPPERPSPVRHENTAVAPTTALNVHEMAPFLVQEPMMKALSPLAQELKDRPFALIPGGTLRGIDGRKFGLELKCQYNPAHRGWDLLRLNW